MNSPKASFNECYSLYSPKSYVSTLLKETKYRLPFHAMKLLRDYLEHLGCSETLKTVFLGSGYGLEVTSLKYGYTHEDILHHWLDNNPQEHIFSGGDSRFKITMVDINEAPLLFATDVGLCDQFFSCDLKDTLPEKLALVMKNETDLLICIGATTYIGFNRFKHLVEFMETSKIKFFCFSLTSFICDSYLQVFRESKLHLHKLGDVQQRHYKNEEERLRVIDSLKLQNRHSPKDDDGLMTSIYIANKI